MNNLECSPLEESFCILMLLFISIKQNFESSLYYDNYLSNDSERFSQFDFPEKSSSEVDTTIIDALRFQFLLQVCSFLDEWDDFTGVKAKSEFDERIKIIKTVVKPARKAIKRFKDIKKFRNEIIAHNYRDGNMKYSFHNLAFYNIPNSNGEMYLVLYSLGRMLDVLLTNFPNEYNIAHKLLLQELKKTPISRELMEENEIKKIIEEIENGIDDRIFDIPRFDIVSAVVDGINNKK
ncbi:hypothetical protein [Labilibaculum euxinus]